MTFKNFIEKTINHFKWKHTDRQYRHLEREVKNLTPSFGLNKKKRNKKIIISLTSYPERFKYITSTLKSLLNQKTKPDKIILWYDCSPEAITPEMKDLEQYGIEYIHVPYNLKPHNKYFYSLQRFPDDIVITVDDDIIYPRDLIRSLYRTYLQYPDCVCARRVHLITYTGDIINPYNQWHFEYDKCESPSFNLFATGIGGVLYPPHCLDPRTFDIAGIKEIINADDIWLKVMELLQGTKVVWARNNMQHPPIVDGTQTSSLLSNNLEHNYNDVYIKKMDILYGDEIRGTMKKEAYKQ